MYMTNQAKQWKKPQSSKSVEIRAFQENKTKSIQAFADKKEISIFVTSSINNAVDWCVAHPDWKNFMTDEERWKMIDEKAKLFVKYFAERRPELVTLYRQLTDVQQNIFQEKVDDFNLEAEEFVDSKEEN